MTQLSEAVARYHKILESEKYRDLSWAHTLQERMKAQNLAVGGRPVSPVLRPHFITRRQYAGLVKAVESLSLLVLAAVWVAGGLMAVGLCRIAARGDRPRAAAPERRRAARARRPAPVRAALPSRVRTRPVH